MNKARRVLTSLWNGVNWFKDKVTHLKGLYAFAMEHKPIAIALIVGTVATTGTVAATVQPWEGQSYLDPGVYEVVGQPDYKLDKVEPSPHSLSLEVGGVTVASLVVQNASLGASGVGTPLKIGGDATAGTNLVIETLTLDGSKCSTMTISNSTIHDLVYTGNDLDGSSVAFVTAAVINQVVGSTRGAMVIASDGSTYDKLEILAVTDDGSIKTLTLANLDTFGGLCLIDRVLVGTFNLTNNLVGDGTGVGSPSFLIPTTTTVTNFIDTNNEDGFPVKVQ